MPPVADIATPDRFRRLGAIWFIMPIFLVVVWLIAPHHNTPPHTPVGVAAPR